MTTGNLETDTGCTGGFISSMHRKGNYGGYHAVLILSICTIDLRVWIIDAPVLGAIQTQITKMSPIPPKI